MLFHVCIIESYPHTDVGVILILCRLSDDHLSVALVDKHDGKKDGKRIKYDWNDAEIKSTAEVNEANQVHMLSAPIFFQMV